MTVFRTVFFCTFSLLLVQVSTVVAIAGDRSDRAEQLILDLSEQAKLILSTTEDTLSEREIHFVKAIEGDFRFDVISEIVIGPTWQTLSSTQRNLFIDLFSDFYLQAYGSQLGGYPGDRFDILSSSENGSRDSFVKTKLNRPKRTSVTLLWRVREFEGKPYIIDLVIDDISVALSHREHFDGVLKDDGIEGVITLLTIRAERLSAQPLY
ncbi:ABC transporter substrate-binding protein [Sneathiella marina]|uniref:ABC transporter substrate-binding protein n=1 Tax=Sneathiella marina TaxID=2950108 RepID=A0ABY4VXS2_9PROT|nr:ABC transporter substrate-binding protein [Sneathiella marina]USG59512.1 ABC transporter substrate-binding protein [Sneathiella marina]